MASRPVFVGGNRFVPRTDTSDAGALFVNTVLDSGGYDTTRHTVDTEVGTRTIVAARIARKRRNQSATASAKRRARSPLWPTPSPSPSPSPPDGPRGNPCKPPEGGTCLLDELPNELLFEIGEKSPAVWFALACAYPRFGRLSIDATNQRIQRSKWVRCETDDDGSKRTYVCDELHSVDDEPAVTVRTGNGEWVKEWRAAGALHRRGGPARVEVTESCILSAHYYLHGVAARPGGLAPFEEFFRHGGTKVLRWPVTTDERAAHPHEVIYWSNGNRKEEVWKRLIYNRPLVHRDERDGPAVTRWNKDRSVPNHEEYYMNGRQHRESGPAEIQRGGASGTRVVKSWWRHNQRRRARLPAEVTTHAGAVVRERWFNAGTCTEFPAERLWFTNGNMRLERWTDGLRHHHHRSRGPAISLGHKNGGIAGMCWMLRGQYSRDDGPSCVRFDARGAMTYEGFWRATHWVHGDAEATRDAQLHCAGGAALTISSHGEVTAECWAYQGRLHRDGGPALVRADPDVGDGATEEIWALRGLVTRFDGPARTRTTRAEKVGMGEWGLVDVREWRINGMLHRDDGPAVEVRGRIHTDAVGTGTLLACAYVNHGMFQRESEWVGAVPDAHNGLVNGEWKRGVSLDTLGALWQVWWQIDVLLPDAPDPTHADILSTLILK